MQQYFTDEILKDREYTNLREDILYHLTKVLRGTNEQFRLVDKEEKVYLCSLENNKARILKPIEENNELDCKITAIISLIKTDKFELILQKLTELGVDLIVPYNAKRSIVKETKAGRKLERYHKILTEAAEQSHRNRIPEIVNAIGFKEVGKYLSDVNIIAYEKEELSLKTDLKAGSFTFVIGPEGGFAPEEVENFKSLGFRSVSLGKRILRAETAAIFLASQIVGDNEL